MFEKLKPSKQDYLKECHRIAITHRGRCLSKVYKNAHAELEWECKNGHRWKTKYSNIQRGYWCPRCSSRRRHTIEDVQRTAEERGGKCFSKEFINTKTKLEWQCIAGHRWKAVYSSIQRGRWCPECAGKQPLTIQDMREIARKRGGKCLSNKYKNIQMKLKWQCSERHVWDAKASHIKDGSWCPYCDGRHLSIDNMQEIAKEKCGQCLSKAYQSAHSKLKWECKNGHIWAATYANIQSGRWCPECTTYIGEKLCRLAFESLFNSKFPKSKPEWLKSEKGTQLELDGYSKRYKIAFEHHGIQHYKFNYRFHRSAEDLVDRQSRDIYKRKLVEKHGVILIEVPQVPDIIRLDKLTPFIIQELKKNKFETAQLNQEKPDYNQIYLKDEYGEVYAELAKIAKNKSGSILSKKYLGSKVKLEFECKEGHKWEAQSSDIRRGTWCPECANNNRVNDKKLTIQQMHSLAEKHGGLCLSKEYIDNKTKLKWQCSEGHVWEVKPSHIKNGSWCPVCSKIKGGFSRRLSILDAQNIALERGGKCLSVKYDVAPNKLKWQCSQGHEWESTYTNIQSGRWCPECARKKK